MDRRKIKTLEDYLLKYGNILGQQAEQSLAPLHVPSRDRLPAWDLLRTPFPAQGHVVSATIKALNRQKAALVVAEMGTGKTLIAMAAVHTRAAGKPYRALVFCPGQLTEKWQREIEATVPGAKVTQLETWKDVVAIDKTAPAAGPEWFVIARDRAKLGAKWRPAYYVRNKQYTNQDGKIVKFNTVHCPTCGAQIVDGDDKPTDPKALAKKRHTCGSCKTSLWQMTGDLWRYEPALFIKRHLKHFFEYLILDEVHETKSAETAQGNASAALIAASKKVIALTGTLIGGYADHLRPLLFRMAPASLVGDGFEWDKPTAFNEVYGRMETKVHTSSRNDDGEWGDDNKQSRGGKTRKNKYVRPGIVPALFGRHVIDKAVFLSLAEVSENLPELEETCIPVDMTGEQKRAYDYVENRLKDAMKEMIRKGDKRLLGTFLNVALCYPDFPFHWSAVGYKTTPKDGGPETWTTVCTPDNLNEAAVYPKESALVEFCRNEKKANRQVWVFVQYTDKRSVQDRLAKQLEAEGLKVGVLKSTVSLAKREAWIAKNGPKCDVILSHPKLVETGLDLFDKGGAHNFCSLVFYETGYNLFTLRQASRRAWRIGQQKLCKVVYFYYRDTMQERAMDLMSNKMAASKALEGEFSTEGLAALTEGDSAEMALAKTLVGRIRHKTSQRTWQKV